MSGASFFRQGRPLAQATPAQQASWAQHVAAQNLLDKVADAVDDGDERRARKLAEQAASLPFDDHEEVWPGPFSAGQGVFEAISDIVEEWPEGDASWIEVLAEALETSDGWAREELLHVIGVLRHDAGLLSVTEVEAARLGRLTGGTELDVEGPSIRVPEEDRVDYVLAVVRLQEQVLDRLRDRLAEI